MKAIQKDHALKKFNHTPQVSERISLGMFPYLNVYPVYYGFRHKPLSNNIKIVTGTPAQLNRAIIHGQVDISCMSSIEFARHQEVLQLIPGFSIGTNGAVESVLLFSRYSDWRSLDKKDIAITDHSATSIELLRILCQKRYNIRPHFVAMKQDLATMLKTCDAALLIGDMALVEKEKITNSGSNRKPFLFDLAEEWTEWQKLPFVFGVWAMRKSKAETIKQSGIIEQLAASKREGITYLEANAYEYAASHSLSLTVALRYLKHFSYDLTPAELKGFKQFLKLSRST